MTIEKINTKDRNTWLALRSQDVTASVAGALFGKHEYTTLFGLWALKTGRVTEDPEETAPMRRGRLMEPVAVQILREENPDWIVRHNALPDQVYYRDPAIRLGATPDVLVDNGSLGVVQVKSVDASVFRRKWMPDGSHGEVEPPLWIAVQAEVERYLTGASWAKVAALVVGHGLELHLIDVPSTPGLIDVIRDEVAKFWRMAEDGVEPDPDYAHDLDVIERMYARDEGEEIDLSTDNRVRALLVEHATEKATEKAVAARLEAIRTELKHKLKGASVGYVGGGLKITWKETHRKGYSVAPTSFRQLRVPVPD